MALQNDYFLLYHGVHFSPDNTIEALEISYDPEDISLYAIILMIGRKKFEKFQGLEHFGYICQTLGVDTPKDLSSLHLLQYQMIETLQTHNSLEVYNALQDTFLYLKQENILKKENYKKLLSLFEYFENKSDVNKKEKNNFSFHLEKKKLLDYITRLEKEIEDSSIVQELQKIQMTLEAETFSIGITGVMNAGKSTMINALLGQEILGTSVVPETANLTLLKYSDASQAKVHYWNSEEWSRIVQSASKLSSMQVFVKETEDVFSENLEAYIQKESRVDTIDTSELSHYTSVKDSGKKCNLIKYVTLENDLSFLKDNVEIVDTPGLDDPVIQREEITKTYISRCDMLFHLMNVSQSASQKDIEFLVDALLYQNITKLLIVITRSDTVEKKALDEVIAYTRQSIEAELKRQNRENRLDTVLETIEFIAISAKMALLCKTDKAKADALGITLEASGLPALEHYLQTNLFGHSAIKSQLIIASVHQKLGSVIIRYQDRLKYQLEMAAKSKEELQSQWEAFVLEKERTLQALNTLRADVDYHCENLHTYRNTLQHFLTTAFYELQGTLRQRVVSDVRYSFEKTKKIPESSRITVIIQTALKDGVIDIVREYKYKLAKKMEEIDPAFEMQPFLESHFQRGFVTYNTEVLVQEILSAVSQSRTKKINHLDSEIQKILTIQLDPIENETKIKTDSEAEKLISDFSDVLKIPFTMREEKIQSDERTLSSRLNVFEKGDENINRALGIHKKMKAMDKILAEIKGDVHGIS